MNEWTNRLLNFLYTRSHRVNCLFFVMCEYSKLGIRILGSAALFLLLPPDSIVSEDAGIEAWSIRGEGITGHLVPYFYPEAWGQIQSPRLGDKVDFAWHRVKVDSGIGLPMVNVSGVDSGVDTRWGYSQLRQRVPYTMFFFGIGLCYVLVKEGGSPSPLTTSLFPSWSVNISFKDDINIISSSAFPSWLKPPFILSEDLCIASKIAYMKLGRGHSLLIYNSRKVM